MEPTTVPEPAPLVAALERGPDGIMECTLFPADATEEGVLTTWITARGQAFVPLEALR